MNKILVIGATGFVGRHLVSSLCANHELICLARNRSSLRVRDLPHDVAVIEADLADPATAKLLPQPVDIVIHLAQANEPFPGGGNQLFAVNSWSTQWLAEYSRQAGVQSFVYTSSGSVYAQSPPTLSPFDETSPCQPADAYGLSKYISEQILKCYASYFNVTILRLFAPYGPRQTGRMIPNIARSVLEGKPIILFNGGEPKINPIYIDDAVTAISHGMLLKGFNIVNIAGPEVVNVRDIATLCGSNLERMPRFLERKTDAHINLVADISKMNTLFDLPSLTTPAMGIERMIHHFGSGTN